MQIFNSSYPANKQSFNGRVLTKEELNQVQQKAQPSAITMGLASGVTMSLVNIANNEIKAHRRAQNNKNNRQNIESLKIKNENLQIIPQLEEAAKYLEEKAKYKRKEGTFMALLTGAAFACIMFFVQKSINNSSKNPSINNN